MIEMFMNYKREVRKVHSYTLTHICSSSKVRYNSQSPYMNLFNKIMDENIICDLQNLSKISLTKIFHHTALHHDTLK